MRPTLNSGAVKVVLLTTETPHHLYFAWKLHEQFPISSIIVESRSFLPRFDTAHPFEATRDSYEREVLLENRQVRFSNFAATRIFDSVNDDDAVTALRETEPDVIVIFGTGKVGKAVLNVPKLALNLHGGNPETYRGLDTHLWAIYHRDFNNLVTTLHEVDPGLDTGDIVFQTQLRLTRNSKLYELRSVNTEACIEMSALALSALTSVGRWPSRAQVSRGRYYSAMPAVLKEDCLRKFERHVASYE
jgi:folate-dependent phosphoribosylglycinamide formyltransferase PurN